MENIDEFLYRRGAIDAALLFETESELDQVCCYSDVFILYDRCIINDSFFDLKSLYYIIGNYRLRVLVLSLQEEDPYKRMADLRPVPSAFVALGSTRKGGVRM